MNFECCFAMLSNFVHGFANSFDYCFALLYEMAFCVCILGQRTRLCLNAWIRFFCLIAKSQYIAKTFFRTYNYYTHTYIRTFTRIDASLADRFAHVRTPINTTTTKCDVSVCKEFREKKVLIPAKYRDPMPNPPLSYAQQQRETQTLLI